MNKELILKSDVLDILFENRNKSYGAYNLRKFYDNRLMKSIGIMISSVVLLSAFSFIPQKKTVVIDPGYTTIVMTLSPPVKEKEKEVVKPKDQPKPPAQRTTGFTKPVIVDLKTPVNPITTLTDSSAIGSKTIPGKPGVVPLVVPPSIPGNGPLLVAEPVKPLVDKLTPRNEAEIMPAYPGGLAALRKFLERNLQTPGDMQEGEVVDVKIRFVVGYDGKLQGFETVQDGGEAYNNEVVRVLKKMPEWVPGKSNGENVSVYFTIPVKFVPAE